VAFPKKINLGEIGDCKVSLPRSYGEQQKIATFLTAVDRRIELLEQKKEKLEAYKKGVMQQLFSRQIRFKQDDGSVYPDWEEKKLGELCKKTSSNVTAGSLMESNGDHKIYGAPGFLQYVDFYQEKDAFISIVKDGAGVGRILKCDPKSSVLGTLDKILPLPRVNLDFLYALLSNLDFQKYTTGSTIPHIYFKDYSKETVSVPSIEEQIKIAAFMNKLDETLSKLNLQINQTQTWKKGLLQQMFV